MDTIASTVLLLISFTVLVQVFSWLYQYLSLYKKLRCVPGPASLPFVGMSMQIRNIANDDRLKWFQDLCSRYKDGIMVTWIGVVPTIHIRKPHQIEVILRSRTLIRKAAMYKFLAHWLGNGLLTSTGELWHQHRRLITPAFHFAILDEFIDIIYEKAEIFNDCISSHLKSHPKEAINIFPLAIKFTLDTVCKTVMGVDMDTQRKSENEYVKALHRFAELMMNRFFRPWLRSDMIYKFTSASKEYNKCIETMHTFTRTVIEERNIARRKNLSEKSTEVKYENSEGDFDGKKKPKAFLDLLMDLNEADENPLTYEEIREQVDTFMFGGHDTTGVAISWALFCLGNNPEALKKVQEEIDDVWGETDEPITKQQLAQLKYLDRVIKEALRLFPSAPAVSRALDHDVEIDNYVIPRGVTVNIQIMMLHRDPELWKDPMVFDPDRFLPENSQGRHPYAYVPFSAGPRNCIGQKFAILVMKTSLAAVLRKWNVSSTLKITDIKLISQIVLSPAKETIDLNFEPRKLNKSGR
ncbi:hypothetical protein QAD02_015922 [Eretmocerus hayati]|uniref:Uncharacterized protein n=1 Tax=Eretmocerus hayati TaxID=131215 RepID=A0ACC2P9R1_9HYME|nr:hypothetical protein QAD02_015922 [Eretmocerus hayati]